MLLIEVPRDARPVAMRLFAEIEGHYESVVCDEPCDYRATYVIRGDRLLWTATVSRRNAAMRELRGSVFLFNRRTDLEVKVGQQIEEAIAKELRRESENLTAPTLHWVAP